MQIEKLMESIRLDSLSPDEKELVLAWEKVVKERFAAISRINIPLLKMTQDNMS